MPAARRMRFVYGLLSWMVATVLVLSALDLLSYQRFFLLSLFGLLLVAGLTEPYGVTPKWRSRLRWLIAIALVTFAAVVARRMIEIVPPEMLP